MDFSGQCNDAYFQLSREGRLKCLVDSIERLEEKKVFLKSGTELECDILLIASGMKYNIHPPFLKKLGLGAYFSKMHPLCRIHVILLRCDKFLES